MNKMIAYSGLAFLLASALCAAAGQSSGSAPASAGDFYATNVSANTPAGTTKTPPVLQRRNPRYQLCAGDQLALQFLFSTQFDQVVTVQPDGYISLRGVGDMHVEGETTPELTQTIQKAYSKILQNPSVTVELKDFNKPYFIVGGQVARPGKFDLRGETTLTEAVMMAGGFTGQSKHSQVLIFRRVSPDWVQVKQFNVKQMLHAGDLREDVFLQPGDMVFVPQNAISKIKPYLPLPNLSFYLNPNQF